MSFQPMSSTGKMPVNSSDDKASFQRIAGKIVRQQQGTETIVRPMGLVMPSEGLVYRFERPLQVAENAPLHLELGFAPQSRWVWWRVVVGVGLLGVMVFFLSSRLTRP